MILKYDNVHESILLTAKLKTNINYYDFYCISVQLGQSNMRATGDYCDGLEAV